MAMACSKATFLDLPQEVRDIVYSFAFDETLAPPSEYKEFAGDVEVSTAPSVFGIETQRQQFKIKYPSLPPRPTWYNLLLCCRRTARDVKEYFESQSKTPTSTNDEHDSAVLDLLLTSKSATLSWQNFPTPTPQTLKLKFRLTHLFDANLLSRVSSNQDNRTMRTLFHVLKRYILHGPHFVRSFPLPSLRPLSSVHIDIGPALSFEDMQFYFGNPRDQLKVAVVEVLTPWVERFVRCGVLDGKVGRVVVGSECLGEDGGERREFGVCGDVWSEEDVVLFQALGYR